MESKSQGTHSGWYLLAFHSRHWRKLSTTPYCHPAEKNFEVIHPHHPLRGQKFKLITYRHNWGEDRVYFHEVTGRLRSIPAGWMTVVAPDPFVTVSAGRCMFRYEDLLKLADLAQRRYLHVDPANRLVSDSLEADWNEKLRLFNEAQEQYEQQCQQDRAVIDEQQRARIAALASDFPRLWHIPRLLIGNGNAWCGSCSKM